MPTRLTASCRALWICSLLLVSGAATGADKPAPPKPGPEAIRAKMIANFTPTFHVDTESDLVVIMTRNRQGKNQDKYNGWFWQAIQDGMVKP